MLNHHQTPCVKISEPRLKEESQVCIPTRCQGHELLPETPPQHSPPPSTPPLFSLSRSRSADLLPPYAVASLSQFDAEARGCQTFMPGQVTRAEGAWKRIQARRGSVLVSNI